MEGTIVQVNISHGGLPKRAIDEGWITPLGIEGDVQAHPGIHGGPLQAILIVSAEVVDVLIERGYPLFYGAMGENLTTRGLDRRALRFGQRLRAGDATIELTRMRQPCATLNVYGPGLQAAMYDARVVKGDPESPLWGLSGFYASVVEPGTVRPGDAVYLVSGT